MKKNTSKKKERQEDPKRRLEKYIEKMASPKERNYFRVMLTELIENNIIPLDLLEYIPTSPTKVGKTRFDQLYDAAMYLVFPGYREETLGKLLGPVYDSETKIWRVMFPSKFRLSHVLLRAGSFQHAFALGCDYACRMSLRLYKKIPVDLTLRIQFVSEKAVRRMLEMRWANRVKKRKQLQLMGRVYTDKEISGARMVALGDPTQSVYSIAKYAEARDLRRILKYHNRMRISSVETETFRPQKSMMDD